MALRELIVRRPLIVRASGDASEFTQVLAKPLFLFSSMLGSEGGLVGSEGCCLGLKALKRFATLDKDCWRMSMMRLFGRDHRKSIMNRFENWDTCIIGIYEMTMYQELGGNILNMFSPQIIQEHDFIHPSRQ